MDLKGFADYMEKILSISSFCDVSQNGIQIECPDKEIKKVAFAVDACLYTIEKARDEKADVLFVHHGIFWKDVEKVVGSHYKRIKSALDASLALFAVHIPLDAHPVYGNNAQMALRLGMEGYDPFSDFMGSPVGFKGKLPFPMRAGEIAKILGFSYDTGLRILDHRSSMIESVGIVSGSGGGDAMLAFSEGLDALITGDMPYETASFVEEHDFAVIAGGHYKSEEFGVKAISRLVSKELGLECVYIPEEREL